MGTQTKGKAKVEDVCGSGRIDPRILDLGTSRRCGQLHTPADLLPEERGSGAHWIGGRVGPRISLDDFKRKILPLPGLELRPKGTLNQGDKDMKFRHDVFIASPLGNVTAASL
jgi:hypothetical protein